MKRFKSLSLKKKRTLAIAGVSVLGLTIVGTIAYNQDSMFFANLFRLPSDVVEFSETFDSPDDWQPCQEIPKTAIATNKNATPRYVRMKINEYWRTKDTQTPTTDHETSDLPLTWDDNGTTKHYAVINTQNDDKWELKNDGWYYYKTTISQNESTDSLLKSVTFNCEVNTVGEVRYTAGGTVGEDVPSDYAEANYHLYITFQMSDESMEPSQHTADCNNNVLYDTIACLTNGIDTDVDYSQSSTAATGNGFGVNTLAAHANDYYPVYYYRGNTADNIVVWQNFCWRALRTTGTGGVKLFYAGEAYNTTVDGQTVQQCNSGIRAAEYSGNNRYYFSTERSNSSRNDESPADSGYMFGDRREALDETSLPSSGKVTYRMFSNDVSRVDGQYVLDGSTLIGGFTSGVLTGDSGRQIVSNRHYFCMNSADSCNDANIAYILGGFISTDTGKVEEAISIGGYDDIEDLKEGMFANTNDSSAKWFTDNWFASKNLNNALDDLEDTVFCNDRSVYSGGLKSKDSSALRDEYALYNYYGAYERNVLKIDDRLHPSVDCPNANDSFTVSANNGNGNLTYPVALITLDEVVLAGTDYDHNKSYLNSGKNIWTMTPAFFNGVAINYYISQYGKVWYHNVGNANGIHPVVSLKAGMTYRAGGDGTASNPYVIE